MSPLFLLIIAAGCESTPWTDSRVSGSGVDQAMQNVNSLDTGERISACRFLAARAGEAARRGNRDEAARLAGTVFRRYQAEKDEAVRLSIVRLCAPEIGPADGATAAFLRTRMAAGEFPGHAALALASLAPPNAFEDLEPLSRHPDPEVRLQAAEALIALMDPRGFTVVNRIWRSMRRPVWPAVVAGVELEAARDGLAARTIRCFGRRPHQ
jgi:HEAT repeat protein